MFIGPSNSAGKVDEAFFYIVGISAVLLAVVTACMIYFLIKYNRKRHPESEDVKESLWLEIVWTAVPTLLALSMFYAGWVNFDYIRHPPKDAMTVDVISRQWSWLFVYANGKRSDVLRVPMNKPVKLVLTSEDVIHSLYIPAFKIKEDCVPGMKTYLWFNANEAGKYDIFCTEYCGVEHSHMLSKVIVMPESDYDKWYAMDEAGGLAAKGQSIVRDKGCLGCHSNDGSKKVGPTFKGLYGTEQEVVTQGKKHEINVDDNYIKNYIRHPNVDIVNGYPPIMPVIPVTDEDLSAIVEYLKTMK
jgi:cytochrome c oxidase subunit II